jgi:hypothetical protein
MIPKEKPKQQPDRRTGLIETPTVTNPGSRTVRSHCRWRRPVLSSGASLVGRIGSFRGIGHTKSGTDERDRLGWAVLGAERAVDAEGEGLASFYHDPTRHAPTFWFPRDCPRGCIWPVSTTTAEDRERFFGQGDSARVHVIEADWLAPMQATRLYAYRLPVEAFRPHEVGGYWVSDDQVDALEQVVIDDLLGQHARARIELRITPSIWPFWQRVVASTVEGSGSRLRNAAPHPAQFD